MVDTKERTALAKALETHEAAVKARLSTIGRALEKLTVEVWPYVDDHARTLDDDELDSVLAAALFEVAEIPAALEGVLDVVGHRQVGLCETLHLFGADFRVTHDDELAFECEPFPAGWQVSSISHGNLHGIPQGSTLARLAIFEAWPAGSDDRSRARARELEHDLIEAAQERIDKARETLGYGGQCSNEDCDRNGLVGQGATCEACGAETLMAEGRTPFGKAQEALA